MKVLSLSLFLFLLGCSGMPPAPPPASEAAPLEPLPLEGSEEMFLQSASASTPEKPVLNVESSDAVLLSGIVDRGDEMAPQSFVTGRFLCRHAKDSQEFPCNNVRLVIQDKKGKAVRRLMTSDGEFVFPAEKEKDYYLEIISEHMSVEPAPSVPLRGGQQITLHLIER